MPRELYVMRHCKSSWDDAPLADLERPLNKRGKRDAERMGQLLREQHIAPDLLLTSPAKRARSTLKRLIAASGSTAETRVVAGLYESSVEDLLHILADLPDAYRRVLLIGHNPTLEQLVHLLTGHLTPLPTGAVACIMLPVASWDQVNAQTQGTLQRVLTPQDAGEGNA